jgi:two-component system chemotaxis response regulator CheY
VKAFEARLQAAALAVKLADAAAQLAQRGASEQHAVVDVAELLLGDQLIELLQQVADEALLATGAEAVARYRELKPDLVTLDIVMPEMDGVEALRTIRQEHPDAHVVMISAIDQRAKLSECIQLGALDFVVKPFDKQRLQSLFQTYLQTAH